MKEVQEFLARRGTRSGTILRIRQAELSVPAIGSLMRVTTPISVWNVRNWDALDIVNLAYQLGSGGDIASHHGTLPMGTIFMVLDRFIEAGFYTDVLGLEILHKEQTWFAPIRSRWDANQDPPLPNWSEIESVNL